MVKTNADNAPVTGQKQAAVVGRVKSVAEIKREFFKSPTYVQFKADQLLKKKKRREKALLLKEKLKERRRTKKLKELVRKRNMKQKFKLMDQKKLLKGKEKRKPDWGWLRVPELNSLLRDITNSTPKGSKSEKIKVLIGLISQGKVSKELMKIISNEIHLPVSIGFSRAIMSQKLSALAYGDSLDTI